MSNNNDGVRYRCRGCRRMLSGPDERPCSNCGSPLREIVMQSTETLNIKEDLIAIRDIKKLKYNFKPLLIALGVSIGTPIVFFFAGKADLMSTAISVAASGVAFYIGLRAATQVREIYKSAGGR
jgi:hypothetical protein